MSYLIRDKLADKKLDLMNWQIGSDKKSPYEKQMIDQLKIQIEELEYGLSRGYTHMNDEWDMWGGVVTEEEILEEIDYENQLKLRTSC